MRARTYAYEGTRAIESADAHALQVYSLPLHIHMLTCARTLASITHGSARHERRLARALPPTTPTTSAVLCPARPRPRSCPRLCPRPRPRSPCAHLGRGVRRLLHDLCAVEHAHAGCLARAPAPRAAPRPHPAPRSVARPRRWGPRGRARARGAGGNGARRIRMRFDHRSRRVCRPGKTRTPRAHPPSTTRPNVNAVCRRFARTPLRNPIISLDLNEVPF